MKPRKAVLLLRISDDKLGDEHGVIGQEKDGRSYAARLGWGIGHVIVENDTSAFIRKRIRLPDGSYALRTVRPGFRQALELLATAQADGLVAIDLDRVARDPRDLEDLIDVVEARQPRIPCESVSGSLRLANDADITMARVMVAINNKSSRDTSRRTRRRHEDLAEQGKFGGGGIRAYGYERDGMTIVEHEAKVIGWMAARILDDEWSMSRVASDLTARGIPTATGRKRWSARSVQSILAGPRIAGLRRFRGEIVGEAVWPAILDRDVWERVRAELAARADGGRQNKLKRWLTGVLICDLCERPLIGSVATAGGHRYWCNTIRGGCGKIAISAEAAEDEIEQQMLTYLGDRRVLARLRAARETANAADLRAQLAGDEEQLVELARMWARNEMGLREYKEARVLIDARLRETQGLLMVSAPRAVREILAAGDVRAAWHGLGPTDRRDVVLALVRYYRVLPHPADRPRRFDPDRLVPVPHE